MKTRSRSAKPTPSLADEIKRMSASEAKTTQAWLDECEEFIETFHAPEKLTTACPGPSAVQRCTDELLQRLRRDFAQEKLAAAYSSGRNQGAGGAGRYGFTAILCCSTWNRSASSERIFPAPIRSGSRTAMSSLFAKRGATPVHNPASNLRIGSGLAQGERISRCRRECWHWERTARRPTTGRTCSTRCAWLR